IELKLTNPKQILVEEYASKTNALKDILNPIIQLNTETFTGKFEVRSKRQGGKSLNSKTIREISEDLLKLMGFKKGNENIHKVVVRGYSVDEDDYVEKLDPIDLIADRLIGKITLEEPLENTDLLQQQRKQQIKELYNKFLPHFNSILGA
ncbi:MAG: hypothetical protein QM534_17885, partial [Sediminibacterium sp.]|nr:hypothetical protein [Sediminibacterium sp.]